jgi:hypothetical protein
MGLNWLATAIANRLLRMIFRGATVAACTYLHTRWGVGDGWKHAIDLTGMMLIQSIYFRVAGVPDWVFHGAQVADVSLRASQFRIVDLIAWTTGLAIVLSLAIRFDPPTDHVRYWSVLCVLWLMVPMAATCWTLAGLLPGLSRAQFSWLATACLLTLLLCVGLEWAESRSMNQAEMDVTIVSLYGIMFGGLGLTMLLLSFAGSWLGPAKPPRIGPPEVKPPVEPATN